MSQLIGPDYQQQFLLPPCLDDWVAQDHPVRFLREFVEQLDLGELGVAIPKAFTGHPPYAPSLLLKIWLYGYFHRIRSTRRLEAACCDQISLLWLAGMHQPDHNTLWRFWQANHQAIRALFQQTVKVALRTGAVGLVLQAVDGTKIEAVASGYSGWSKEYMEKLLAQLEASLAQTETALAQEAAPVAATGYRLPTELAEREALREQIKKGLEQLAADGREHYHPVEPESRRMKVGSTNRYAYNAQAVADAQDGIIVAQAVTRQETDNGQLVPMIQQAQKNLAPPAEPAPAQPAPEPASAAAESVTSPTPAVMTVADTGYGSGADVLAAAQAQLPVLVTPAEGTPAHGKPYAAQHFRHDPVGQTMTCPQQRLLDHEGQTTKQGVLVQRYRCHVRDCPVRAQCTQDPKGRQVEVWPHTAAVQALREQLGQPESQALLRQRSVIIEPRFGQLKAHDGFRRWTVRGLEAVSSQWALVCAILNLRVLYRRWQRGLCRLAAVA